MIYTISEGLITAKAETKEDSVSLLNLSIKNLGAVKIKHRKHKFTKICPICGKGFKGRMGLGTHTWKAHPRNNEVPF